MVCKCAYLHMLYTHIHWFTYACVYRYRWIQEERERETEREIIIDAEKETANWERERGCLIYLKILTNTSMYQDTLESEHIHKNRVATYSRAPFRRADRASQTIRVSPSPSILGQLVGATCRYHCNTTVAKKCPDFGWMSTCICACMYVFICA